MWLMGSHGQSTASHERMRKILQWSWESCLSVKYVCDVEIWNLGDIDHASITCMHSYVCACVYV